MRPSTERHCPVGGSSGEQNRRAEPDTAPKPLTVQPRAPRTMPTDRPPYRRWFAAACLLIASHLGTACGEVSEARELDDYRVIVNPPGTSLTISVASCGELRVSTTESDEQIRLTVMQIGVGEGDACAGSTSQPVSLVEPLGDRSIVDDSTGDIVGET